MKRLSRGLEAGLAGIGTLTVVMSAALIAAGIHDARERRRRQQAQSQT